MQLSRFTDYAVRVLIFAAIFPERLVTLHEMSAFYGISLAHLRKVVHKLGKLGYLKTFRGKHGGMKLGVVPAEINLGKVIGELEGTRPLIDCVSLRCVALPACGLPAALKRAQQAFYRELDSVTLADVVQQERVPRLLARAGYATDGVEPISLPKA